MDGLTCESAAAADVDSQKRGCSMSACFDVSLFLCLTFSFILRLQHIFCCTSFKVGTFEVLFVRTVLGWTMNSDGNCVQVCVIYPILECLFACLAGWLCSVFGVWIQSAAADAGTTKTPATLYTALNRSNWNAFCCCRLRCCGEVH